MDEDNRSVAGSTLDDAIGEFYQFGEQGTPFDISTFLARFPHLKEQLATFLDTVKVIEEVARPTHVSSSPKNSVREITSETSLSVNYELLEELGRGGMGVVYKAVQRSLNRFVAVKMILAGEFASQADVQRFHREAEAIAGLDHPGIVPIYETGSYQGRHFFSMKLMEGGTLASRREAFSRPRDATVVVRAIALAIHHAHQHGILHRDLKPANILLDQDDNPHVTDFGLARPLGSESDLTQSGATVGTPSYMAPEQAACSSRIVSTAADIYSMGAILYELLTGVPPFRAASHFETVKLVLQDEPIRPRNLTPTVPRDLETICLKCLSKDPNRRYDSAAGLADDLGRWLNHEPIRARRARAFEKAMRWCQRNPVLASLTLALVLVLFLGVVGVTWSWIEMRHALAVTDNERQARALAQLDALLAADAQSVPDLIDNLRPAWPLVHPRLLDLSARQDLPAKQRLRVGLALLHVDPGQVNYLYNCMMSVPPDEVILIRKFLHSHGESLTGLLWSELDNEHREVGRRLRAACALAMYDPLGKSWERVQQEIVGSLVAENPIHLAHWAEAFRPVRRHLVVPLVNLFRDSLRSESERTVATSLLSDYAGDDVHVLTDLIVSSDPRQFLILLPRLRECAAESIDQLKQVLLPQLSSVGSETPPSQNRSDARFAQRVVAAGGLVTEHFALCQTMNWEEFEPLCTGLRNAGYRPSRVRPYSCGNVLQVAAIWLRDGREWKFISDVSVDELRQIDLDYRKRGFLPVDVAGYIPTSVVPPRAARYTAIWVKSDTESECRLAADLSVDQFHAFQQSARKDELIPLTLQAFLGADRRIRVCSIWQKGTSADFLEPLIGDEVAYERHLGVGLQMDVSTTPNATASLVQYEDNIRRASEILAMKPDDMTSRRSRGQALLLKGDSTAALPDLSVVIDKVPSDAGALQDRALAFARLGRITDSLKDLATAHQLIDPMKAGEHCFVAARIFALAARPVVTADAVARKEYINRALGLIRQAITLGHDQYVPLSTESDFETLWSHPTFYTLVPLRNRDLHYAVVWHVSHRFESTEFHGQAIEASVEQAQALANQGFRPHSISTIRTANGALLTSTVWHRAVLSVGERVAYSKRQARAAITLVHLDRANLVWPFFREGRDPTVRTELIHLWNEFASDRQLLARRLAVETDTSARHALILSIGQIPKELWQQEDRRPMTESLWKLYKDDPDPGIHSATRWALTRWGHKEELQKLSGELASDGPRAGKHWYVDHNGHTLAIVKGPVEFRRGSPTHEVGRWWNENAHRKHIDRSLAVATTEVTVSQFERFLHAHPEVIHSRDDRRYSPNPDCPITSVSWYVAAAYCRWLSELEGIPEHQMCFPPIAQIKEGMVLPVDYITRTGYRLPTDGEWEFACRGGTETMCYFGENPERLSEYVWHLGNAGDCTHAVGMLKPNELGLFDMLGNVVEWCIDPGVFFEPGIGGWGGPDTIDSVPLSNKVMRVLRGGAFDDPVENLRAAKRNGHLPTYRFTYNGFRVVRTYR